MYQQDPYGKLLNVYESVNNIKSTSLSIYC